MASPAPWRDSLLRRQVKKDGKTFWQVLPCQANVTAVLRHHERWRGVIAFNAFAECVVTLKVPPWDPDDMPTHPKPGPWTDSDTRRLINWFARNEKLMVSVFDAEGAIEIVGRASSYHPVRDWLSGLKWDGKPRLDAWLVRIGGAEDTAYTRAVGAKWMISAVARAFEPGCKADHLPIFEGPQGIGKSTLLRDLASEQWFLETAMDLSSVEAQKVLANKWIVELSELDSLTKSEVSRVKAFLSERVSTFRASYGRRPVDNPRQCVFAGTTNSKEYLKDDSGARRFWPIKLTRVDLRLLAKERGQLWAEATARYKKGERWHFEDPSVIQSAAEEAEARRQKDPWEDLIARWLAANTLLKFKGVTTHAILVGPLQKNDTDLTKPDEMRVAGLLRLLGWDDVRRETLGNIRERVYRPSKGPKSVISDKKVGQVGQVGHSDLEKMAVDLTGQPGQPFYGTAEDKSEKNTSLPRVAGQLGQVGQRAKNKHFERPTLANLRPRRK